MGCGFSNTAKVSIAISCDEAAYNDGKVTYYAPLPFLKGEVGDSQKHLERGSLAN